MNTGYPSIDKPWLKYYSEEAISAPLPECSVFQYLWQNNKDHLDEVAIVYFDKSISYGEMFKNIEKTARAFAALGIKTQDVVTACIPNTPEAIYIFYALNCLGAVCHFVEPIASETVMRKYLSLAPAKLLITIPETYPLFNGIRADEGIEQIIVVDVLQSLGKEADICYAAADLSWKEFIRQGDKTVFAEQWHESTLPVCILHTGGTTGMPKGAVLNNVNFNSLVVQWKYLGLDYRRGSTLLSLMPPFVSFGLTANLHVPLSFGMKLVLIPEYDPSKTVAQIKQYKPNCIPASPAHWEAVYNDPEIRNMDLSFLKVAYEGGDTLNINIERGLNDIFAKSNKDLKIQKAYGMTENTTAVTMSIGTTNLEKSVGIPLPQTVIGVFDENRNELPYGEVGEICVRSRNIMVGYHKNEKATAEAIITHSDGDKWLHTGDVGEITPDGILYIKGRLKRIIIRHDGIKVYPVDVESKIAEHPAVKNCAVVGMKDPKHIQGEIPVAFVVLQDNISRSLVEEDILDFCNQNVIYFAIPQRIYYVDNLPMTHNGKNDFRALEEIANKQ